METIFNIFQVTRWQDLPLVLLDMAIAYYIIYRILLLIKGTRAAQMLLGLMLIIVFFFISSETYLNLRVTNWFLEKFIANFFIIIVVIFQSDIRRALAQAGRTPWLSTGRSLQEASVLEEIIKASVMLSQRGLGALIVIEREADLGDVIEDGIGIDAEASKDLLFSMFVPEHQNPLHDGAVIIHKGRISAAGCFLPLTTNPHLDKTLGTRHRAGIGLTENTDAAVVIVSEERRDISIAYRGELYKDLETTEMREMLQGLFLNSGRLSKRDNLKDLFRRLRAEGKSVGASDHTED